MDIDKKIKKCLKSYLAGKKHLTDNKDLAYEYFKQCIRILNYLRDNNIKIMDKYLDVIDETETEAAKYLTLSIESTIEEPMKQCNNELDLFTMIETGSLEELKKLNYNDVNFKTYDSDGLTPLHLAIRYGDTTFLKIAFRLGAKIDMTNKGGHTLLEMACLEKDPNMITFMANYGANMKKHLFFRENFNKKLVNHQDQIDIAILLKIIMAIKPIDESELKESNLDWVFTWIMPTEQIGLSEITFKELILHLASLLRLLEKEKAQTYLSIIKEEITQPMIWKLGCPPNKLHILLYNLYPFIDYPFTLSLDWLVSLEIKYIILKLIRQKKKINTRELREELGQKLFMDYIEPSLLCPNFIQNLIIQWILKIKV